MPLTTAEWHARFLQQTRWTHDLRGYLWQRAGLSAGQRVIEVGCGTGAVLAGVTEYGAIPHGLDLNRSFLHVANGNIPSARLVQGNALRLPYAAGAFDASMCHFLLLWVSDPTSVIQEMRRVTRPGRPVMALAEPDYGGRIDYPEELGKLGEWQAAALAQQGADVRMGRRLGDIFHTVGLQDVEVGVLGGQWAGPAAPEEHRREWAVLQDDLHDLPRVERQEVARLQEIDEEAAARGARILFVPTFYAFGFA